MSAPAAVRPSLGARLWPLIVVGVLLATVIANLWVMRVAEADTTFTIEPDYYGKALRWDAHQAQLATNAALGWGVVIESDAADGLVVQAHDASGAPLSGLAVQVTGSANRAGDVVERAAGAEQTPGAYAVAFPHSAGGIWRLTLTAVRGEARYEITQDVDMGRRRP